MKKISEDLTNDQHYILRYIYKNRNATTTGLAELFLFKKAQLQPLLTDLLIKILHFSVPMMKQIAGLYSCTLTDEGKKLFEETEEKILNLVKSFITKFDRDEIENFINTYEKLARIIRGMR